MNFFISTIGNDRFYVNPQQLFSGLFDLEQSALAGGNKSEHNLLGTFESIAIMANKIVANRHFDLSAHEKFPKVADEFYEGMSALLAMASADKKEPKDFELKASLLFPSILKDLRREYFDHYSNELAKIRATVNSLFKAQTHEGIISSTKILRQMNVDVKKPDNISDEEDKYSELLDEITDLQEFISDHYDEIDIKKLGITQVGNVKTTAFPRKQTQTASEVIAKFVQSRHTETVTCAVPSNNSRIITAPNLNEIITGTAPNDSAQTEKNDDLYYLY